MVRPDSFDSPDGRTYSGPPLPPLPPKWTGKYRKRPVVVEAVQLVDDDACDWDEIARWCGGRIYNIETSPGAEPQTLIDIRTLEGTMTAAEGWWVVRGVVGEFHPVRADIFEVTHEPARVLPLTAPGPRDPQAGQDHAKWLGWAEAQGYPLDTGDRPEHAIGDMRDAFTAGMLAARDLDAATLAAEVRAGHVRIETGPQSAPGLRAALESQVRLWRHHAEEDPDDDSYDSTTRATVRQCANDLATILARHPESPAAPEPSFTEWAVFYGGPDPDSCAGWDSYDDEAGAAEQREWIVSGGVACRTVTCGPWTVTVPPNAPPR